MCAFFVKAKTTSIDVNATKERGSDKGELEEAKWVSKEDVAKSLSSFGKPECFTPGPHTIAFAMLTAWTKGEL